MDEVDSMQKQMNSTSRVMKILRKNKKQMLMIKKKNIVKEIKNALVWT